MPSGLLDVLDTNAPDVVDACANGDPPQRLLSLFREQPLDAEVLLRSEVRQFESDAALQLWQDGRTVALLDEPPWPVPEDPDWSENPFRSASWQTRYHSLAWLAAPARAVEQGDQSAGERLKAYVLDWIGDNQDEEEPPSSRSWFDGSVRRRADVFVATWNALVAQLSPGELEAVLRSLHRHGELLHGYLSEPRFEGHNHNLFHAMSLYNLAAAIPELRGSSQWKVAARERIESLADEMVNPADGVSTEQSATYHALAMGLLSAADRFLALHGDDASGIDRRLEMMTRFGSLLIDPTDHVPAIGDTGYGRPADRMVRVLERLQAAGLAAPEAEYVLSRGASGDRPADAVFFEGEGYAIFRPSYGEAGEWEDDLHVVVDMGPARRVHGHHDAMNVLLAAGGQQLLVDSGGPYRYRNSERKEFVAAAAHNTVITDGASYASGDVTVHRTEDTEAHSLIDGSHAVADGVQHRRTVILVKPRLLIILDRLSATDGTAHRQDLLYHLPPDAAVELGSSSAVVRAGDTGLGMAVDASHDLAVTLRRGEEAGIGWVTPGNGIREPAPVLDFALAGATDAWFVTAILPEWRGEIRAPAVSARRSGDAYLVTVRSRGETWRLEVAADGAVTIRTAS